MGRGPRGVGGASSSLLPGPYGPRPDFLPCASPTAGLRMIILSTSPGVQIGELIHFSHPPIHCSSIWGNLKPGPPYCPDPGPPSRHLDEPPGLPRYGMVTSNLHRLTAPLFKSPPPPPSNGLGMHGGRHPSPRRRDKTRRVCLPFHAVPTLEVQPSTRGGVWTTSVYPIR